MTARLEAKIDENNEKFEVPESTIVFQMDMHQEKMEATLHSIPSEQEETITHRVEDVLSYVDQKTQSVRKELNEKINENYRQ
jgi:hypothetical protein